METLSESKWITSNDLGRSATASMLRDLSRALQPIRNCKFARLLDIGCGFGGLTRFVGETLAIDEIHGIDIDGQALGEAAGKGVITHQLDVGTKTLPFEDNFFDLVLSFGMLDYLPFFDHFLREVSRVTRPGGYTLISLPNLASWHNRVFLLMGYQPRDVEVSQEIVVGVHPWYNADPKPTGHVHSLTTRAFEELMTYHGFETLKVTGATPGGRNKSRVIAFADALFSRKVTLARRFFYLGIKGDSL